MLNKKIVFALSCAALFAACTTQGGDDKLVGGFDEQTNNIAGVLLDNGSPVAGVTVMARHLAIDTVALYDTTGADGSFGFRLTRRGYYALTSSVDSLAVYETFDFEGSEIKLDLNLKETLTFKGSIGVDSLGLAGGVTLSVPGSPWSVDVDSAGHFEFEGMPFGEYFLMVSSGDSKRYDDAVYAVKFSAEDSGIYGPLPTSVVYDDAEWFAQDSLTFDSVNDSIVLEMPSVADYSLLCWWTFDYLRERDGFKATIDARGRADSLFVYGIDNVVEGNTGKALHIQSADQFGVVENDHGILDSLTELTFETVVMFDSIKDQGAYRKNIVGKLGFGGESDKDVFSFALINKECGVSEPSVAFFLADGSGDSLRCENAVIANVAIDYKSWTNYVVTWDGDVLTLYKNGVWAGDHKVSVKRLYPSNESIFFGKEKINVKLDDVRLGAKAITSADVLYRYYLRGRSL